MQGAADKVVLLDLSEGAAKGGTMDLEIFPLPNVEISKGIRSCCWNGSEYCTVCVCARLNESRTSGDIQRLWHIGHLFKKVLLSFHSFLLLLPLFRAKLGREGSAKLASLLFQAFFILFMEVEVCAAVIPG